MFNRDKSRDLNCKIDNWSFNEGLIEPFDLLKNYLFQFQTLASKALNIRILKKIQDYNESKKNPVLSIIWAIKF